LKVTFFYGLAKNAGKTTTLNWYINTHLSPNSALTSIGWDGESYDHLFGHSKPPIYIPPNTYFITFERFKPEDAEVILPLKVHSPFFGELYLYKARKRTGVQLVGPKRLSQLRRIKEILESLGIKELILDGAVDRRVGFEIATHSYIIISPIVVPLKDKGREYKLMKDIAKAYHQLFTAQTVGRSSSSSEVFIKREGGVTEETLEKVWKQGYKEIWIDNPARLVVFPTELPKWLGRIHIRFFRTPELEKLVWNPFDSELGVYDRVALELGEKLSQELEKIMILQLVKDNLIVNDRR